ncbi:MAG: hypothetical protein ACE5EH_03600 [Gammaproteobacteria bacterium]
MGQAAIDDQISEAETPVSKPDRSLRSLFSFFSKKGAKPARKSGKTRPVVGFSTLGDGVSMVRVSNTGDKPVIEDMIYWPRTTTDSHSTILYELVNQHPLAGANAFAVTEPGHCNLHLVEAPNVESEEMLSALRWRIKELIDYDIEEAAIDAFDIPGRNLRGSGGGMIYAVVTKKSSVLERIGFYQEAGVSLSVLDIPELALRNIATLLPEEKDGVALIHLSKNSGMIVLCRDSVLYLARNIHVGSINLMRTISSSQDKDSNPMFANELSAEARNTYEGIIIETQRSLDYYERHSSNSPIKSVVISASDIVIPDEVLENLSSGLNLPVKKLELNGLIDSNTPVDEKLQSQTLLALGVALREAG